MAPVPGGERWQAGLVGEDTRALADLAQNILGENVELEADPAHPLRHQPPVEFQIVAGIDPLLAVERQAIGIFRDGDLRQKRLGRNAALDDVRRGWGLNDPVGILEGVFGSARDDHPELRRDHVEPFGHIFPD